MPTAICQTCGRETNSACSNFFDKTPTKKREVVDECYAAYSNGKWEKGCGFDKTFSFRKAFAMHLITGKEIQEFLDKEGRFIDNESNRDNRN